MDYLQQLLNNQPVEWKKLGEVCDVLRGKRLTKKDMIEQGRYMVYQNSMIPLGKYNEYNVKGNTAFVICAGSAGEIGFSSEDFWAADDVSYFDCPENIHPKFVYYYLLTKQEQIRQQIRKASIPRLSPNTLKQLNFPIPPLSVQSRIVEILDKFTAMEAELEEQLQAELELRKKQYAYYREQLLNFSYTPPSEFNVVYRRLGELCDVLRGRRLTKKQLTQDKEGFAVYHGGIIPIGYYPTANRKANSTMVINVGASAGTVGYSREEYWSSDGCYCFTENPVLIQRFLFYYLQSIEHKIKSKVRVAGIPTLDANILYNLEIPIPPLSEQQRIVEMLDKFDTLTSSISEGLPLEIKLRRQQYEYYREQLLDFRR